jgi:hypothetical protein
MRLRQKVKHRHRQRSGLLSSSARPSTPSVHMAGRDPMQRQSVAWHLRIIRSVRPPLTAQKSRGAGGPRQRGVAARGPLTPGERLIRATQVLLPSWCLHRRAAAAEVIGAALVAKADGHGHRAIAARFDRPPSTVRAWLRRARGAQVAWLRRVRPAHPGRGARRGKPVG